MTINRFRVQKRQWKRWAEPQRIMFNAVYSKMRNQQLFKHPKAPNQPESLWKTICWNAAWLAADLTCGIHATDADEEYVLEVADF